MRRRKKQKRQKKKKKKKRRNRPVKVTLFSPAKINFFLRVLNRRKDGYHNIASLFQAIDLGDDLSFSFAKRDILTCTDASINCDSSNLVLKAVELFRRKTGLKFGAQIHLEKHIPKRAGLGGGSSNAATALWALNALHDHLVEETELQKWSAEIGSDIPFFFSHGSAYCTGRGERVRDLHSFVFPDPLSFIKPKEELGTPAIFKALDLKTTSSQDPEDLLDGFFSGSPSFINDLEAPSFHMCPSLKTLTEKLLANGFEKVFMTGSGTGLICVGDQKEGIPIRLINRPPTFWYTHQI